MNSFSYYSLFDTKGVEYIAIIIFLIMLIPFWIILNKHKEISQRIQKVFKALSFDILNIPQGIFHSKNHTWAFMEKSGSASVGLDDFLLHTTGEVTLTNLKNSGEFVNKGEILIEVVKDDKHLNISSPISGKIVNNNPLLIENPEILNEDPFGKGWIYKIKPSNWIEETSSCYLAEESTIWSRNEINRFKDFLAQMSKKYSTEQSPLVLQDGGEVIDHVLSELPNVVWKDFNEGFLEN